MGGRGGRTSESMRQSLELEARNAKRDAEHALAEKLAVVAATRPDAIPEEIKPLLEKYLEAAAAVRAASARNVGRTPW